jgi:SAM-dependent methyltransferase
MGDVIDAERIWNIDNKAILAGFEQMALQYADKSGKFLVVGHGKDIRFPLILASEVREEGGHVVYQDLSPLTRKVIRGTKAAADDKKVKDWKRARELIKYYGNVKLKRFPNPPFDTIIYLFEAHHVRNLEKSFRKAYDSLNPGGTAIIVDYHMKGIPKGQAILMFNSDREREVASRKILVETEFQVHYGNPKDDPRFGLPSGELHERDWYQIHTYRGLDDYIAAMDVRFKMVHSEIQPKDINKLCLGIWKK